MRRKNRTARAEGNHPGDYEKQLAFPGFADTPKQTDYTTARVKMQSRVAWLLSAGAENATCMSAIMKIIKKPRREIRRMIQADRKDGFPICADCKNGYFLPSSAEERLLCVKSMRRRAKEILRSAAAIENGKEGV